MTVYRYRTRRGGYRGGVPLSAADRHNLLELYSDLNVPVFEIAAIFDVHISTIYRWLELLHVQAYEETGNVRYLHRPHRKRA